MERLFLQLNPNIIITLSTYQTMQNEFAKLPGQEEQPSPAKATSEEDDSCEPCKKTCFKWICSNLERIASILIIVYFLVLIVRLVALDDAFINLVKPQAQQIEFNSLRQEKNIDLNELESILDRAKTKGKLILAEEDGFQENTQKQAQKRLLEPSTAGIQNRKKPSLLVSSQKMQKITGNSPELIEDAEDYRIMLQEVQAEKRSKQTAGKYSLFEQIYSQMDESLHKTVRSISREERQPIIAKYFKDKEGQRYVEELLKENYKYQLQRSKADTAYLQLAREDYELSNNDQSSTPMCIILATHNNAFGGQIVRTLNSAFNQQHPNFQIVIADADSSDNTLTTINQYLDEHKELKKKSKVLALQSESQAFAVLSAGKECKEGSLVVILDGNTELIGKEALSILDSTYRISNPVVLYPSHYSLDAATQTLSLFKTKNYDQSQVFMLSYRHNPAKYGRILACKAATMQNILPQHIQHNGKYFEFTCIDAIAVSLLELSCGRTKVVDEVMGLAGWDSSVVEAERQGRKHEMQLLSMKSKFDVC